ncbi:hypothetical protein KV112_02685 [Mycolicibacter sp. MYC123]|uniref:PE domain-containing protein n=1 Tax=[Mycobacterium] zoologicum TaxID=2872311 RepID=A0ABU5YIT6_9MYCO|nr:hypothetical protein [Mycolicibacter sp. MYC123]MEB3048653.1 hypothetical protein [Mycolicibacter sp. MYC123]
MTNYGPYVPGETFPVLDADRSHADREYQRHVIAECGFTEPYISETDDWCTMPLRVVVDSASDVHIEFGPYDLNIADIQALQRAIGTYYENVNRSRLRVIGDGGNQ